MLFTPRPTHRRCPSSILVALPPWRQRFRIPVRNVLARWGRVAQDSSGAPVVGHHHSSAREERNRHRVYRLRDTPGGMQPSPWKQRARHTAQALGRATDSTAEKSPEVEAWAWSRGNTRRRWRQRQEGIGRGDAVRLLWRGKLRRVNRRGEAPRALGPRAQKRGEPHDRLRGAINPQGHSRSKPSQSGGTAGTERARCVAAAGRRWVFGLIGSGREWLISVEGRFR